MNEEKFKLVREIGIKPIPAIFKFYKQYGSHVMFFSDEYLEEEPIEDLVRKDIRHNWFMGDKKPDIRKASPDINSCRISAALERIADALEKQNAGEILLDVKKLLETLTKEAVHQVDNIRIDHAEEPSILLEIERSQNQFGEPVVQFRSSPL